MSKKIKMSARAKPSPELDNWVEARLSPELPKPSVKPKRLTIDIHPDLHKRLKISCVQRGIQIADLLRQLIETDLSKNET